MILSPNNNCRPGGAQPIHASHQRLATWFPRRHAHRVLCTALRMQLLNSFVQSTATVCRATEDISTPVASQSSACTSAQKSSSRSGASRLPRSYLHRPVHTVYRECTCACTCTCTCMLHVVVPRRDARARAVGRRRLFTPNLMLTCLFLNL